VFALYLATTDNSATAWGKLERPVGTVTTGGNSGPSSDAQTLGVSLMVMGIVTVSTHLSNETSSNWIHIGMEYIISFQKSMCYESL
jgi:hypothetical protein